MVLGNWIVADGYGLKKTQSQSGPFYSCYYERQQVQQVLSITYSLQTTAAAMASHMKMLTAHMCMVRFMKLSYLPGWEESMEGFGMRLNAVLEQMMYVSGETAEASAETTGMIEEIVRQQVIEMVRLIFHCLRVFDDQTSIHPIVLLDSDFTSANIILKVAAPSMH